MTDRPVESRDEIELVEILRIIWKWKYLILVGTLVCALIAAVVNLNRQKIYRTNMVLRLGEVGKDRRGNKRYVDSPENIRALIESGGFSKEISKNLKTTERDKKLVQLKFKCGIPKKSNILKISYETVSAETGIKILNLLYELLLKEYRDIVKEHQDQYDTAILTKTNELVDFKEQKIILQNKIKHAQKRLSGLASELESLNNHKGKLIENRNDLLNSEDNNILLTFLYNNMLHQNIQLKNSYNNEIFRYQNIVQKAELDLKRIQQKLEITSKELENLKREKNNIQSIEILKPPVGSRYPIRPNVKLNVVIAGVLGLFVTLLMAFLLEYIRSKKESERQ